jgi:hypothetical protein
MKILDSIDYESDQLYEKKKYVEINNFLKKLINKKDKRINIICVIKEFNLLEKYFNENNL